jgi:regulation of enolase protein 1 (concanavalin A-like superfamily)
MPSIRGHRLVYASLGLVIASLIPCAAHAQVTSASAAPWVAQNIGHPPPTGSSEATNDGFTISAAGSDASVNSDQFRFLYQPLADDVRIAARVESLAPALMSSKAGLMIRTSLEPWSKQGSVLMNGDGTMAFHSRRDDGGAIARTSGTTPGTGPQWLGIERRGTRVTAYSSSDGQTWTVVGSDSIDLGATVFVGIAVASHDISQSAMAQISRVTASGLPPGYSQRDIGGAGVAGSGWQTQGTFTVTSGGAAAVETEDQFHFVYQPVRGDLEAFARVASVTSVNRNAKAGVMIRESLDAGSRYAFALLTAGNGYAFDRRVETGSLGEHTDGGQSAAPGWVRLVRRGDDFEAFLSSDGTAWSSMGSTQIAMAEEVYVGLAIASQDAEIEATAVIDGVSVAPLDPVSSAPPTGSGELGLLPNLPPTVTLATPLPGQTFQAPAAITLSALAADPELRLAQVTFRANATVIGTASTLPYTFTWSSVPAGSYTVTAVAADADGGTATSAPVSITVQGASNQPPTVALTSPADGATFTAPATVTLTASASDPENRLARVEFWRAGTLRATDTTSPYTTTRSSLAAGTYTWTAVAVDEDGGSTTSAPITFTVEPGSNQPPTVTLTSPANGATFTAPAAITLTASASDPENRLARVEFWRGGILRETDTTSPYSIHRPSVPAGTYTWTAVAVDADGGSTTSVPVTFTVEPASNQPPSVVLTSPANGATFTAPATIALTATASDPENRLARVDFWRGTTWLATEMAAPYEFTWSSVPAGTYTLTATATDADGGTTTSAPVSITVQAAANQPPTVALTSPANGATFTAPATVTLEASASDPENRLARVDFYRGTTLLGTDTASPYSFTWSSVAAGSYTLTAVAADADGGTTTSTAVSITVQAAPPNQPPTVALTSPANGATFTAPATVTLAASASDPENRLARVEFYRGTTLLGTDTVSPYSFTWSSVAAGSYTLTAKAVDADGGITTSAPVSMTVNPPPSTTRVVFTASTDHDTTVTSYVLEIFPSGADVNTGSPIASTDLAKPVPDANRDITVDQTAFFNALSPGNYLVTVVAVAPGGRAKATPVTYTR